MALQIEEKLVTQARTVLRREQYALRTEKTYLGWIQRYVCFHHNHHPICLGEKEIETTLNHLALKVKVAALTQNQANNGCDLSLMRIFSSELWLCEDVHVYS